MFKSLREKLKNWTDKISKSKKEEAEESQIEEMPEPEEEPETEKIPEKKQKKTPKEKEKPEKKLRKGKTEEEKKKSEEPSGQETKKEIELPMRFNAGLEKFEPDLEKLGEISSKEEIPEDLPESGKEQKTKKSFFRRIVSGGGKVKISEKDFEDYRDDLEMLLLENNVAFEVSDEIIKKLKEKILDMEISRKEIEPEIKKDLKGIISDILVDSFDLTEKIKDKKSKSAGPFVILFFGINGSGKTTSIAKLSEFLKSKKISCVFAAADTFRAASIEQIKEHGSKLGIKVIAHDYGSDPASVGFDAVQYAKKNHIDCVLIDTAGRMHTEKNLIKEMEKISKVCKPDLKIFIGESITGNDATEQARTFNQNIGIDGIILSKSDIDEKGGTALSVGFVTKKPVLFLGTGQEYKDIEPFDKGKFLEMLGL